MPGDGGVACLICDNEVGTGHVFFGESRIFWKPVIGIVITAIRAGKNHSARLYTKLHIVCKIQCPGKICA